MTNLAFAGIEVTITQGNINTDQTGRFPVTSRKCKKYVFVLYYYDTNAIITEPLKDITGKEILRAYKRFTINNPIVDSNQQHIGRKKNLHRHSMF